MDFAWSPEQDELRNEAGVAADAVAQYGRHNDSWINGYSEGARPRARRRGWIGLTWPVEYGGGGRPAIDRLIVGEELITAGAPIAAMWFADRQMGPTLIAFGATISAERSCRASCPERRRGASGCPNPMRAATSPG